MVALISFGAWIYFHTENENDKGRTKHMDVRYHSIRDFIKSDVIKIKHMPSESMIADILT